MDVLGFAVVLIALTIFVAAPLYARRRPQPLGRSPLAARRDALMSALRDLEVDRASGLLEDADYERERAALEAEAAEVTAELTRD